MGSGQRQVVLASMVFAIIAWIVAPWFGTPRQNPDISQEPLLFDGGRALAATREFVTRYPRRPLGSLEARQSTAFFRQRLQPMGFEVSYGHFEATVESRTQVGRNVLALKRGPSPEILAVLAHYDTADTTVQGAMDNGSGIGALIELGRVLTDSPLRHTLLLVATDGKEWGMLGASDLASSYEARRRIMAALSLDYAAAGDLANLQLAATGRMRGFSPGWLRDLCRAAAAAEGLPVLEPHGFMEHAERAILLSWTDQGPLLAHDLPAINLGSGSADPVLEHRIYHSSGDRVETLKAKSLEQFGRTAERILRSLDERPPGAKETAAPFLITRETYLSEAVVAALHILTFRPLLAAAAFSLASAQPRLHLGETLRELLAFIGTLLPLIAAYYAIILLTNVGRIPAFTLYPPGPKQPLLENPDAGTLFGLAVVAVISAVASFLGVRFAAHRLPPVEFGVARAVNLILLAVVSVAALWYNSFWAATFLLLPAWCWAVVGRARGAASRALNILLIVGAGLPWAMVTVYESSLLGIGWNMVWYAVLALSTGMFRPYAFLLSAAAVALGTRLLALQFLPSGHE